VNEYGNEIPAIIKSIKDRHVKDDEKDKAEIVFSTVHRCKGMEYDIVQLVNDFITEEKLEKLKKEDLSKSKLNEEINLLYVAVTRTKNSIYIPESLMPKDFPACPEILVRKTEAKEEKEEVHDHYQPYYEAKLVKGDIKKKYNQYDKQQESREPYKPWLPDDDLELEAMFKVGMSVFELAQYFERTNGAIRSRLKKLQLLPAKPAK
jgi:superfamily I DNA/RNA helicase